MMHKIIFCQTPIGRIGIAEYDKAISHLFFNTSVKPKGAYAEQESTLLQRAAGQLNSFFAGELKIFDLPLAPEGTTFQKSVWAALLTIPYGETRSYGQIAKQLGKPGAARAVGLANSKNPIGIIIPCHRVIGADGSLTGYAGGLDIKENLLALETKFSF